MTVQDATDTPDDAPRPEEAPPPPPGACCPSQGLGLRRRSEQT